MQTVTVGELLMTIPVGNRLGEGVLWDELHQLIWWTDILSSVIYRFHLPTHTLETLPMPHRVGSFGLTANPMMLIVAFDIGIAHYDIEHQKIKWLAQPESQIEGNRFNDGRTDRQGRFWAGTMVERRDHQQQCAALYCIDEKGDCHLRLSDLEISNGLCWSPDGRTLYHADSPKHQIYQYDFDIRSGLLSHKRLFATTSNNMFPDGSDVDCAGYLWNAQWGGGQLVRYRPDGEVDLILKLPVTHPTSIAFGGPKLDLLIVTSAKHAIDPLALSQEPQAGDVFIYQLDGILGLNSPRVRG
ncbi:SMP-30/gluconolactonase/LRE family protein [Shewanella sp. KJ2020]|uniref:SMP-30/gluconolactonase/LRE family protein n=1 Tax=Shewanella sp. KJ2020 TaxID=2919172 RepID=UPI0020A7003F|nr:SMP-30/gluconolactonase/LRE family protein [Shewanella sp. KJ2020]MCP3127100.1 SMP-30/gluconolactonase/LRE family protein [Shewanella sp. KJ2020]